MSDTPDAPLQNAKVMSGIAPYVMVEGAIKASEFYQKAFAAQEVARNVSEDGVRCMHLHLYINGASLMLTDPWPEFGHGFTGIDGITLHLQVEDVDSWWARAVEAGCEIAMPLETQFWGDRYGQLKDPFGVMWSLAESAA